MEEEKYYLPIKEFSFDKLGFEEKAREIATFINEFPSYLPFSISINGPWGSGKSTMMNFIENSLDEEKCRVIRFNPWMNTDSEQMINSLFEEIYYVLDGGLSKAKLKFAQYSQKVLPSTAKVFTYFGSMTQGFDPRTATLLANSAGEATKSVGEILFNKPLSRRKSELHKEMEFMYSDTEKKIVVMIDELDRLFPNEIITVFQMIKSILDFPGLIFVVAMDETVVNEALENKGISRPKFYLQKIFQKSFHINTKYQIRTLADHFLLNNLEENQEEDIALKECIQAFLYYDKEHFISFPEKPSDYDESLGSEWEWGHPSNFLEKLNFSYGDILKGLNDDLNLNNPRTFIKFAREILDLWPRYYDFIKNRDGVHQYCIQTAFLILLSHFYYPGYTESRYLEANYVIDGDVPQFVKRVRTHLNETMPKVKKIAAPNSFTTRNLHLVINSAILYLNQFPDYLRHNRMEKDEKDSVIIGN